MNIGAKPPVSALPTATGIAFQLIEDDAGVMHATVRAILTQTFGANNPVGWNITAIAGLPLWFVAEPAAQTPLPLDTVWEAVYRLRITPGIAHAEPTLRETNPLVHSENPDDDGRQFATQHGLDQFELWGVPYSSEVRRRIRENKDIRFWHRRTLRVAADEGVGANAFAPIAVGSKSAWIRWRDNQADKTKLPGAGIIVGHPDTGYQNIPELQNRRAAGGKSYLSGEAGDGVDPGGGLFPGHGTRTGTTICGETFGIAPGAQIIPLRVSDSVVHFDFRNVAEAITHAVANGADIISLSLGGPRHSRLLRAAIAEAHKKGVIVAAAAGNISPVVVFPAAYPEMLAIAGCNAAETPWQFSSSGFEVDITAPGQDVWNMSPTAAGGGFTQGSVQGVGTSFAVAMVAGLAALWVSHHGGRNAIASQYGGDLSLVPFAFAVALRDSARVPEGWESHLYGRGIANADRLLEMPFPNQSAVLAYRDEVTSRRLTLLAVLSDLFTLGRGVASETAPSPAAQEAMKAVRQRVETILGKDPVILPNGAEIDSLLLADELFARIGSDRALLVAFYRWQTSASPLLLLDLLLKHANKAGGMSVPLRERLSEQKAAAENRLSKLHKGTLKRSEETVSPPYRKLRVFAFDPSLQNDLDTVSISEVTIPVPWENGLTPGPVGEYLEVVDMDPASGCVYAPINLNDTTLLAQDGLAPSQGNPQFHQQMVYAVAMNTIGRFERALGRPVFWSPLRPWESGGREEDWDTDEAQRIRASEDWQGAEKRDRFVRRLRVYPHALRQANAFYSPTKRALLFGYFPAVDTDTGRFYPGGTVFTALSHDIIAHETTHALLDGMHYYFNEPTNPDVLAFHEAISDIVALLQHFTYPEVLRHQLANARGDLTDETLLGKLAQEFGQATGGHGALREALGTRTATGWERKTPDPTILQKHFEPHERGAILVSALFGAFLQIYEARTADLRRIYSGGTGILPAGRLHPDLVNRLADEAGRAANDILNVCIRAMDYVPPMDITFGEFLRAAITADWERNPNDRTYRIALINAFQAWGIYPRDVRALSEESLRWREPQEDMLFDLLDPEEPTMSKQAWVGRRMQKAMAQWGPGGNREEIFATALDAQALLQKYLAGLGGGRERIPGINLGGSFRVGNLRPARRMASDGSLRTEIVFEVIQTYRGDAMPQTLLPFRGGATVIVDLATNKVRYIIYKRLFDRLPDAENRDGILADRARRQEQYLRDGYRSLAVGAFSAWGGEDDTELARLLEDTYRDPDRRERLLREPFALLHRRFQ
jgi:hypothetical protein